MKKTFRIVIPSQGELLTNFLQDFRVGEKVDITVETVEPIVVEGNWDDRGNLMGNRFKYFNPPPELEGKRFKYRFEEIVNG